MHDGNRINGSNNSGPNIRPDVLVNNPASGETGLPTAGSSGESNKTLPDNNFISSAVSDTLNYFQKISSLPVIAVGKLAQLSEAVEISTKKIVKKVFPHIERFDALPDLTPLKTEAFWVELKRVKEREPLRHKAIVEYIELYSKTKEAYGNPAKNGEVKIEDFERDLKRLYALAAEADWDDLKAASKAREQGTHWEYKSEELEHALKWTYVAMNPGEEYIEAEGQQSSADNLGEKAVEKDDLLASIDVLINSATRLKRGLTVEEDLMTGFSRKEMKERIKELQAVKKEADATVEWLKDLSSQIQNKDADNNTLYKYRAKITELSRGLRGKITRAAEIHLFLGVLELELYHHGEPYTSYSKYSNREIQREIQDERAVKIRAKAIAAENLLKEALKYGYVDKLSELYKELKTMREDSRLTNGFQMTEASGSIAGRVVKRSEILNRGIDDNATFEEFTFVLGEMFGDYQALDRILGAAEGERERYECRAFDKIILASIEEKFMSGSNKKRRNLLKEIVEGELKGINNDITLLSIGAISWEDLPLKDRQKIFKHLKRADLIIGNQAAVIFNYGVSSSKISGGPDDSFGAAKKAEELDSILKKSDFVELWLKDEIENTVLDSDDRVVQLASELKDDARLARLEKTIKNELTFLKDSKGLAEEADKYLILFGTVDLNRIKKRNNDIPSLPYWGPCKKEAQELWDRLWEIKEGKRDESKVASLEKSVSRYFKSPNRSELGFRLGEDEKYVTLRNRIWFWEGILTTALGGWAGGGVGGWAVSGLTKLGQAANLAKGASTLGRIAAFLIATERRAHTVSLLANAPIFKTLLRSAGHEGRLSFVEELMGYLHTIGMLGSIGFVTGRLGSYDDLLEEEAFGLLLKREGMDATKITGAMIAKEAAILARKPEYILHRLIFEVYSVKYEAGTFQAFDIGWAPVESGLLSLFGDGVEPGREWYNSLTLESVGQNIVTVGGLKLGGVLRGGYSKARDFKLTRKIKAGKEAIEKAKIAYNEALENNKLSGAGAQALQCALDAGVALQKAFENQAKSYQLLSPKERRKLPPEEAGLEVSSILKNKLIVDRLRTTSKANSENEENIFIRSLRKLLGLDALESLQLPYTGGLDNVPADEVGSSNGNEVKAPINFGGLERAIGIIKGLVSHQEITKIGPLNLKLNELLTALKADPLDLLEIEGLFGVSLIAADKAHVGFEFGNEARRLLAGKMYDEGMGQTEREFVPGIKEAITRACLEFYRTVFLIPDGLPISISMGWHCEGACIGNRVQIGIAAFGTKTVDLVKEELIHLQQEMRHAQVDGLRKMMEEEFGDVNPLTQMPKEFIKLVRAFLPPIPPEHPEALKSIKYFRKQYGGDKEAFDRVCQILSKISKSNKEFKKFKDIVDQVLLEIYESLGDAAGMLDEIEDLTDIDKILTKGELRKYKKAREIADEADPGSWSSMEFHDKDPAEIEAGEVLYDNSNQVIVYTIDGKLVIPKMPVDRDKREAFFKILGRRDNESQTEGPAQGTNEAGYPDGLKPRTEEFSGMDPSVIMAFFGDLHSLAAGVKDTVAIGLRLLFSNAQSEVSGWQKAETEELKAKAKDLEGDATYNLVRTLGDYNNVAGATAMGTIGGAVRRIKADKSGPVGILELGAGEGNAGRVLKNMFGDNIVIDNIALRNEIPPENESAFEDTSYADIDKLDHLPRKKYDLIISIYGGPYHSNNFPHMLNLVTSHLAVGGEALILLNGETVPDNHPIKSSTDPIFTAASRALGLEISISNHPSFTRNGLMPLYMRRTADGNTEDIIAKAMELTDKICDEADKIKQSNSPRNNIEAMEIKNAAATAVGAREGLKIKIGYRIEGGGEVITDWKNIWENAKAELDKLLVEWGIEKKDDLDFLDKCNPFIKGAIDAVLKNGQSIEGYYRSMAETMVEALKLHAKKPPKVSTEKPAQSATEQSAGSGERAGYTEAKADKPAVTSDMTQGEMRVLNALKSLRKYAEESVFERFAVLMEEGAQYLFDPNANTGKNGLEYLWLAARDFLERLSLHKEPEQGSETTNSSPEQLSGTVKPADTAVLADRIAKIRKIEITGINYTQDIADNLSRRLNNALVEYELDRDAGKLNEKLEEVAKELSDWESKLADVQNSAQSTVDPPNKDTLALAENHPKRARLVFGKLLRQLKDDTSEKAECYYLLAKANEKLGRYKEAHEHAENAADIYDSLNMNRKKAEVELFKTYLKMRKYY